MTTFNIDAAEYTCYEKQEGYTRLKSELDDNKILKIRLDANYIRDEVLIKSEMCNSQWFNTLCTRYKFKQTPNRINYIYIYLKEDECIYEYEYIIFTNKKTYDIYIRNGDEHARITVDGKPANSRTKICEIKKSKNNCILF
jgi:hypothetical protein